MSDYNILEVIAIVFACAFVFFVPWFVVKLQLLFDIRKYNKTHVEHQLDERTPLFVYNSRYRDWQLKMFCNEKKGNNENEK